VRVVGVIYVRDELCSLIISNEQFHSVEGFIAKNNLLCIIELFSFDFLDPSPYTGFVSWTSRVPFSISISYSK
jgi:hypothetical protein